MNRYVNKQIGKMTSYSPPIEGRSQYNGLLLDFNERTAPVSQKIVKALKDFASSNLVQTYPEYSDITAKIAKYANVKNGQVMLTNGSDQGIDLIFRAFTKKDDKVIIPAPSFAMFNQCGKIMENKIISPVYEAKKLNFPFDEVISLIKSGVKLIVICNPNNPTGTIVGLKNIEKILDKAFKNNTLVYIDEAYFEYSGITATGLVNKYPNLIISRTFSKAFGLASLRIGYVISDESNIKEMMKIRGPYDITTPAVIAARTALENLDYVKDYVKEVMKTSKPMIENFFKEEGIKFFQSSSNFILFKPKNSQDFEKLNKDGILTRLRTGANIDGTIRLTIGLKKQMEQFIKSYRKYNKYAFLDRDGTLIFEPQDTFKIDSIDKLKILDGVISGLKKLKKDGFKFIMVSNQDGIGSKSFPKKSFDIPQNKFLKTLKENGIVFDEVFICPHLQKENCDCRKPKIGLVKDFLNNNKIDLKNSFMSGDRETDREFAKNIGVKFIKMDLNGSFKKVINQIGL